MLFKSYKASITHFILHFWGEIRISEVSKTEVTREHKRSDWVSLLTKAAALPEEEGKYDIAKDGGKYGLHVLVLLRTMVNLCHASESLLVNFRLLFYLPSRDELLRMYSRWAHSARVGLTERWPCCACVCAYTRAAVCVCVVACMRVRVCLIRQRGGIREQTPGRRKRSVLISCSPATITQANTHTHNM